MSEILQINSSDLFDSEKSKLEQRQREGREMRSKFDLHYEELQSFPLKEQLLNWWKTNYPLIEPLLIDGIAGFHKNKKKFQEIETSADPATQSELKEKFLLDNLHLFVTMVKGSLNQTSLKLGVLGPYPSSLEDLGFIKQVPHQIVSDGGIGYKEYAYMFEGVGLGQLKKWAQSEVQYPKQSESIKRMLDAETARIKSLMFQRFGHHDVG